MAVKYSISFRAHDNVLWRVDISNTAYTGDIIQVRGVSESAVQLARDGTTDDPFGSYIKGTMTINCYNEGQIDVNELEQSQDKDFIVTKYREGILKWQGYLNPDGISAPFLSTPYALTFTAICGLSMLEDIPYVHIDLPGTTTDIVRSPINYIRCILFSNLGIMLPLRWVNNLECTAFPNEDVFCGSVRWSELGEGFLSYQSGQNGDDPGPPQSCDYILQGILQSMQSRIVQDNGIWLIQRIPDIVTGSTIYKQVNGDLGVMTVQRSNQNILKKIGRTGYPFINEDAVRTVTPGIKSCTVTYSANIRQNILPNGSQDLTTPDAGSPLYWGFFGGELATSGDDLAGRAGGHSTNIIGEGLTDTYFTMLSGGLLGANGLPIDTQTMIKYINFGFLFSLVTGFDVDPSTGFVTFENSPFRIKVILNLGTTTYYLNKFGFWVTVDTYIPISVEGYSLNDIAQIDFNALQNVIVPTPTRQPQAGDISDIQVLFRAAPGQFYILDNIYINIDSGNEVYSSTLDSSKNTSTDERSINISSSFNGYMLSNFMTSPFNSDAECYYSDGFLYTGTLTGLTANAIMRYRYKSSRVFNGSINVRNGDYSFNELYLIDTLGQSKFMPINSNYNVEKCITSVVAMECRNDQITLTEKFYSSNDNQLSN